MSRSSKARMTAKSEPVDMSPAAIAARLDKMRALFELMKYLSRFRPVDGADPGGKPQR
jgi:hypothetical protein